MRTTSKMAKNYFEEKFQSNSMSNTTGVEYYWSRTQDLSVIRTELRLSALVKLTYLNGNKKESGITVAVVLIIAVTLIVTSGI